MKALDYESRDEALEKFDRDTRRHVVVALVANAILLWIPTALVVAFPSVARRLLDAIDALRRQL